MATVKLVIFLILILAAMFGWLIPLTRGFRMLRRKTGGKHLALLGIVWGSVSVIMMLTGIVLFAYIAHATRVVNFDASGYTGAFGTVAIPYKGQAFLVLQEEKTARRYRFTATEGEFLVPPGSYFLSTCTVAAKDGSGALWTAETYMALRRTNRIVVLQNAKLLLQVGPPYLAAAFIEQWKKDSVSGSIKIIDRYGDQAVTLKKDGKNPSPPELIVLNEQKQPVSKLKTSFGIGGVCRFSGEIPGNIAHNLFLRPVFEPIPLDIKPIDTPAARRTP